MTKAKNVIPFPQHAVVRGRASGNSVANAQNSKVVEPCQIIPVTVRSTIEKAMPQSRKRRANVGLPLKRQIGGTERKKQKPKTVSRAVRAAEKKIAEAKLPASKTELAALFEWVHFELWERCGRPTKYTLDKLVAGCDHSLKHTLEFAAHHKLEPGGLVRWLNENGGYCDCEVVMNVEALRNYWSDLIAHDQESLDRFFQSA